MAIQKIPLRTDLPKYTFSIILDSVVYILSIYYIRRMNRYLLDINDSNDVNLLSGIVVLLGVDFLAQHINEALPPGSLIAVNTEDGQSDAGQGELGDKVILLYEEAT